MKRRALLLTISLILAAAASPAFAAGLGFHGGMSIDPDDLLLGVRYTSDPVAEHIYIVPSGELGVGDITMIAGNLDGHFRFTTSSDITPYAGAGITINWFDFDGGSDTDVGGSILGGVMFNPQWFVEAKIGLGDVPDGKIVVGYHMP